MVGKRRRPVDRDEVRRLLAAGLKACGHCRPDSALGITELSGASHCRCGALIEHSCHPVDIPHSRRYIIYHPRKESIA
jgi:hypothetical protein